jgi:ubiquinone/menaquinone biosynthesis C-methylase UbiE
MTDPALSFGAFAASYDRGRPGYPDEAVTWALGEKPLRVLELGAGTGKLTEVLVGLGHDVFAIEPDEQMLDVLSAKLPDVRATVGSAEQIPAADQQYDAVVAGQAFHWFDLERALPEIARVLAPGGRIVVIDNERDTRIPWVRRLDAMIGRSAQQVSPSADLDDSGLFSAVEEHDFRFWQVINRESVQDLVLASSHLTTAAEEEREAKRAEVLAFYDDYGRGMDGMQLPYQCRVFRSAVLEHARVRPVPAAPVGNPVDTAAIASRLTTDTATRLPRVVTDGPSDEGGDELLLIDFR